MCSSSAAGERGAGKEPRAPQILTLRWPPALAPWRPDRAFCHARAHAQRRNDDHPSRSTPCRRTCGLCIRLFRKNARFSRLFRLCCPCHRSSRRTRRRGPYDSCRVPCGARIPCRHTRTHCGTKAPERAAREREQGKNTRKQGRVTWRTFAVSESSHDYSSHVESGKNKCRRQKAWQTNRSALVVPPI
jgi:hypothetical protein